MKKIKNKFVYLNIINLIPPSCVHFRLRKIYIMLEVPAGLSHGVWRVVTTHGCTDYITGGDFIKVKDSNLKEPFLT